MKPYRLWEEKNVGKTETKGGVANDLLYYL
jgi:hypothetical protein